MMEEIVEGSFVQIDFGIEYEIIEREDVIGILYQGMKGKVKNVSWRRPIVILSKESKEKVEEFNSQNHKSWRTEPMIPIRFLFPVKGFMLKNE